ncbi:hypothetical protein ABFS83_06G121200 [Erythranthe nasuta]
MISATNPPLDATEEQVQGIHSQLQIEVNVNSIEADPGLRLPISVLAKTSKELETIRRAYLLKGPCQPRLHTFPQSTLYGQERRFSADWYNEFGSWLEYSESKDEVFCLCCYLFKVGDSAKGGDDKFVGEGYKNWHKKKDLRTHEGNHDSVHHHCYMACQDLMNYKCHIHDLHCGGHDESNESPHKGKFVELIKVMAEDNDEINRVVLDNSPGNCIMKAPDISKPNYPFIFPFCLEGYYFEGKIIERFIGVVHVPNTTARCLKVSLESLFTIFGLSLSRVRGQCYDGASNMQGEFNGLKSLILKENKSAFYVHCFAHQLQLALVQITKKNKQLFEFFISFDNFVTGSGLNHEATLKRSGDTRWNSYYFTILSMIKLFLSVVDVLEYSANHVLGITNDLSQALQKKDQDFANAMKLSGRVSQRGTQITNLNHYQIEVLYIVIDLQLSELNDRFYNTNTELLSLISYFDPSNSFSTFDINSLVKLTGFYPNEFDDCGLIVLENQLENFIRYVRSDQDFSNMVGASRLAEKLVAKRKNITYPSVYLLLKLSLILPVATASVAGYFLQ